ncbi:hypothetical protein J7K93_00430 [bacterium]|nr:hypothetical protein [bacterium]
MNPGLIGGIIGCIIGIIGGLIGTLATIRNTSGPREKAFTIKASIIGWAGGIIFLLLLFLLPAPWRFFLWIPYGILLPICIITWNRTQQKIRNEESQH